MRGRGRQPTRQPCQPTPAGEGDAAPSLVLQGRRGGDVGQEGDVGGGNEARARKEKEEEETAE